MEQGIACESQTPSTTPARRPNGAWRGGARRLNCPSLHASVGFVPARFLTREQVSDELNISKAQAYALLRRGELRAAKIGGRGDYRIGRDDLDADIERTRAQTKGD